MSKPGQLYLIPIPIAEDALHTLSKDIYDIAPTIKYFFVENIRTARRFLKSIDKSIVIDDLAFSEIDKREGPDLSTLRTWIKAGHAIGVMSEAGCPGIADPGSIVTMTAHNMGATVTPLTGPNSLVLALMASGLNGQSFCFNGYLPVKDPERQKKIKQLEAHSKKENQTQLFIETPYRNNAILQELFKHCHSNTLLCIAQDITGTNAFIKTKKIVDWKKEKIELEKLPTVFLLLA